MATEVQGKFDFLDGHRTWTCLNYVVPLPMRGNTIPDNYGKACALFP
jgi:hypothetical protein